MITLTEDRLLGGRLRFSQPRCGYRAAIDPVLLAAIVPARAGDSVLEGGTGAGAAALCLLSRLPHVRLTGIEIDPALAWLARHNAAANGMADRFAVIEGDLLACRSGRYDHAMANPPYRRHGSGSESPNPAKHRADREPAPDTLPAWVAALARRLARRGSLSLVMPAARLADSVCALRAAGLGELAVLPVAPRAGEGATRILLQGRKSARGPDRMLPPLVLHRDDGRYTAQAELVLRHGAGLPA